MMGKFAFTLVMKSAQNKAKDQQTTILDHVTLHAIKNYLKYYRKQKKHSKN